MEPWRPRINIDINEDLYFRQQRTFHHGVRNQVLLTALDQIVTAIEKGGQIVQYLIANGKLRLFTQTECPVCGYCKKEELESGESK